MERDWFEENFYFCMLGVLSSRKDPFVAIEAFTQAKHENPEFDKHARLSLKTNTPGLHSSMEDVYPGLRIYYDNWPYETMKKFYASQHVLLAPSRGEGKNMPALEFMSTGGTVIATNWAGHTQWLDSSYAYPLNYELKPVDSKHPKTLNARADVQHLKELMLHTFENRAEARMKGELASRVIPKMCSWDTVVENLLRKLQYAVPNGNRLWEAAMECREEQDDDD
jgi:glycosyltransferase involved in cell wall biosynthesis